ncbi:MAG: L,D-transpeptidase family protein [Xanthobacteraceae bacterium]|nr:L,D-transpeptidase family protein [Xanthobacteraceae bacterium]
MLTAAGSLGAAYPADAALFYYQDSDSGYSRPSPSSQPKRQRNARKNSAGKKEAAEKEASAKPQGPLIIAVSIDKQKVRIYDANGFFAESPVSTGMKGHSTPMGVFSIIQKHKFHHSNIYSGAPMPYMQRITWSGVAMHAGVLPGYPASHGCIRMPMAFAMKMWNWTKMGARVVVTPGEITPANFTHPLLVAQKVTPQPVIADEPKADAPAVKGDKGADAGSTIKSENSVASLELRSTVGHALPPREPTRTADASSVMPATRAAVTMSDATSSASPARAETKPEALRSEAKPEAEAAPGVKADTISSDTKPAEAAAVDVKSDATGSAENKVDEAQAPAPAADDAAKNDMTASTKVEDKPAESKVDVKSDEAKSDSAKAEPVKIEAPKTEVTKADETKADEAKPAEAKAVEKPAEPAKAIADAPAAVDVKKDTARLPGVEKAAAAKNEPKRTGQIAVFVSRKDSKLYVRQNFAPLFDVPVAIAPSDRPLGTHVFTAEADKTDPNLLRWSVVSMPVTARNAARNDDDDRPARRRKGAVPAEVKARPMPDSPAEALDRITIPQDAMARIAEALSTGGSIIVSDQGINQGETGEGTDFIVSLR